MAFEIFWEDRGAHKRFHGHVTDRELLDSVVAIQGDPRFDTMRYTINDFLAVTSFSVAEQTVRIVSAIGGAGALTNAGVRVAIVAADAQIQALADIYAALPLTAYPTRTFDDLSAARAWLAADPA